MIAVLQPVLCRRAVCLVLVALGVNVASGAEARPNTLTPEELAEGWILLFDGETRFGWKASSDADWRVADGVLSASKGSEGLLCTTSQFGNYVLKVEFRGAAGCNSGVFLRTNPKPTDVTTQAYELNIAGTDNPFPTGSLVNRKRAPGNDSTQWQSLEVSADGPRFVVRLNGRQVLDYTDPKPLGRGYVGLQYRSGRIEFRNIKLRPLGIKPIFTGKDLTGWKTYPQLQTMATVTPDGAMRLQGGKGQIESAGQYADFTLQLEVFVGGKGLNSGVFFRSIPGDVWNGYESQIHNGYLGGDRTRPQDGGTGGIFRRQNARKVVPDDFQWFSKTIHADGRHMAVWVNGYQVSDWTDNRPAHDNPRNGLRLKAGTIILQGHDPTTDLMFRNLRIAELPPRDR